MTHHLDLNDLNFTAARLTVCVINKLNLASNEDKQKIRLLALSKIAHFLRSDVACDLNTTVCLMEDILKQPLDGTTLFFINHYNPEQLDQNSEFNLLFSQICFDPRSSVGPGVVDAYDKKRVVFEELQICAFAVITGQPYTTSALCDNQLSPDADRINSEAFQRVYNQILGNEKTAGLLNSNTVIEKYLERVFGEVRECQSVLASPIEFSSQIQQRRQPQSGSNTPQNKM